MKKIILSLTFLITTLFYTTASYANNGAVILLFHRFGEDRYPSTNVTIKQLENIITYIQDNNFNVIPLKQAVDSINNDIKLPEKSIVITIDDAFKSVYDVAYPHFKKANIPFTVFLSSKLINQKNPNYMSWNNVTQMSKDGIDFQAHTVSHQHMTRKSYQINYDEIEDNIEDIQKHTGIKPTMLAYPFGETSNEIMEQAEYIGIKTAFGQHSGVYNKTSPKFYIPRFSINERYASTKRLKLILNTKPFPVETFEPQNPYIVAENNPPQITVKVTDGIKNFNNINCFRSDTGKILLEKSYPTFYMVFQEPFQKGRTRINCTMPDKKGGYKWLGMQYVNDK